MLEELNSQLAGFGAAPAPPPAGGLAAEAVAAAAAAEADAPPLFQLEPRLELLSRGRGHAVAFAVCNDAVFVATSRGYLLRHDAGGDGAPPAELELPPPAPAARVRRLFVDPLGVHALVALQDAAGGAPLEWLYVAVAGAGGWRRPRPLPRLRGAALTAVAWGPALGTAPPADVLVGTAGGELLALSLGEAPPAAKGGVGSGLRALAGGAAAAAAAAAGGERLTPLAALPGGAPVAGLAQVALAPGGARLVLALAGARLHLFRGGPALAGAFAPGAAAAAVELPIESGGAQLALLGPPAPAEPAALPAGGHAAPPPRAFAVLSPCGVVFGGLDPDPALDDPADHLVRPTLLPAPRGGGGGEGAGAGAGGQGEGDEGEEGEDERPLALALTAHHLALLYPSRLEFVNRASKARAAAVPAAALLAAARAPPRRPPPGGAAAAAVPLGLSRDALAGRLYVLAGDACLEVDASNEDRDMWRVLLAKGDAAGALAHARAPAQRCAVYLAQAEAAEAAGRPREAAALYGRVTARRPAFEDLALRVMSGGGGPAALDAFLAARLDTLGERDAAAATMVATWQLELTLDRLAAASLAAAVAAPAGDDDDDGGDGGGGGGGGDDDEVGAAAASAEDSGDESPAALAAALRALLERRVRALDPGTTAALLAGAGRLGDLEAYARARGDWEAVLEHLVAAGDARRALDVLRRPGVPAELAVRFAPALFAADPAAAAAAWAEGAAAERLDPARLVPALLPAAGAGAAPGAADAALRYARWAWRARGAADGALHDLAVALLAARRGAAAEAELLEHLAAARGPRGRPLYDAGAALRAARRGGHARAAAALLVEAGLHDDAVAEALAAGDRALAASVARGAGDAAAAAPGDAAAAALARRLWLAVAARAVADGSGGAAAAAEVGALLADSGGALRAEDVLPLFPDGAELGALRGAVLGALDAAGAELAGLRGEMAAAAAAAADVRAELEALEARRGAALGAAAACARCGRLLGGPPPAGAGPAGGALPRLFVFPTGNAFHGACLCAAAAELAPAPQRARLLSLQAQLAAGGGLPPARRAALVAALEAEAAGEDPFCGEATARLVAAPLVDWEAEREWEL